MIKRDHLWEVAGNLFDFIRLFENIIPGNCGFALSGGEIPCEDPHRCRFARSVRTEKSPDLSLLDFKAEVLDGDEVSIIFCKVFHFNHP